MTGQVRTHDDTAQARGTHQLESAMEETSQYMERKRSREGSHQLDMAESREKDESGNEENGRVRSAHFLETAVGEIDQDTERKRPSDGYSQTRHLQRKEQVRTWKEKKSDGDKALTNWR